MDTYDYILVNNLNMSPKWISIVRQDSDDWWNMAQADLDSAIKNIDMELYYVGSFLCHQAVEKALKSVIILEKEQIPKLHSLKELAIMIDAPDEIVGKCRVIDPAYTETRYNVKVNRYHTKQVAEELLRVAEELMIWIQSRRGSSTK